MGALFGDGHGHTPYCGQPRRAALLFIDDAVEGRLDAYGQTTLRGSGGSLLAWFDKLDPYGHPEYYLALRAPKDDPWITFTLRTSP